MELTKDDLKQKYKSDFIFSVWDQVRLWFLVRRVKKQKINQLWEANMDKLFYETQYPSVLSYDDTADRNALVEERKKSEQNIKKIMELEETITNAKAVKAAYRKNDQFISEVKSYILMLDIWMNR